MLEVKRKNLDRREWHDDFQRTYKCKYIKEESFEVLIRKRRSELNA